MAEKKIAIPYGTYGKLKGTVERFLESTVPTRLNRHVLDDVSGVDFSGLTKALQFLGLMADDGSLKPGFRDLVEARKRGEPDYKTALLKLIEASYGDITQNVDISAGTLPEIEKAFRDASGYQGQMLEKAIRFYVKALEDCNVKVSEHITKPRVRREKPKDKKPKPKKDAQGAGDENGSDAEDTTRDQDRNSLPSGFARLPIPGIDGGFIQYPKNLTDGDCTMYEAMVTALRTYVKSRKGGEGKKP